MKVVRQKRFDCSRDSCRNLSDGCDILRLTTTTSDSVSSNSKRRRITSALKITSIVVIVESVEVTAVVSLPQPLLGVSESIRKI